MIESNVTGHAGELAVHTWPNLEATWLAVLVHGYGEHLGRYEHVAAALHDAGALVVGGDLVGHGGSEGERALITDVDALVADVHAVTRSIATPLPTVLIGHSVGGLVASRYAQAHGEELAALVLSAPVLGAWQGLDPLADKEVPDAPLDPSSLSRDEDVATAYAADPLVYHGNWHRETLESLERALDAVASGEPRCTATTTGWCRSPTPGRAPTASAARRSPSGCTPARGTRCSTRPTATRCSPTWSLSSGRP